MVTTISVEKARSSRAGGHWNSNVSEVGLPFGYSNLHPFAVRGCTRVTNVGGLVITEFQPGKNRLCPPLPRISGRQEDTITYLLPTLGRCSVGQFGRQGVASFGDAVVLRSLHPYSLSFDKDFASYSFQLPYRNIASKVTDIDSIFGYSLRLNKHGCCFLQQAMRSLLDAGDAEGKCTLLDLKVAGYIVDLSISSIEETLCNNSMPAGSEHQQLLRRQICGFILENLENPRLSPACIAKENNLSTSYLHKLFKAEKVSVTRWILQKRLERSHGKLLCPSNRHLSISSTAFACGFNSLAHFSTRFKEYYGVSPRKLRDDH